MTVDDCPVKRQYVLEALATPAKLTWTSCRVVEVPTSQAALQLR